ncbi:MAG TPA: hypothetical protein ACFYED_07650 [Candidatus Tripitaka californicus]|uniref:hypothetical protein n=1 Tax=Candidatus Tripitaka californicus TaxID=3367616 RepID=UPI0040287607|nr:hypothetical protein [Planctomycetota bacterium]
MARKKLPISKVRQLIHESDERSCRGRSERLRFLLSKEDPNPFPTPALAYEYYEETRLCWYVGAFVATIVMAQLSFEELFRANYRAATGVDGKLNCGKKVNQASFSDLIKQAKNDKWISENEATSLHSLRKNVRNPYVHVKDAELRSGKQNLKSANFISQYLKIRAVQLKAPFLLEIIEKDTEQEARESVQLLVTLFPEISRRSW